MATKQKRNRTTRKAARKPAARVKRIGTVYEAFVGGSMDKLYAFYVSASDDPHTPVAMVRIPFDPAAIDLRDALTVAIEIAADIDNDSAFDPGGSMAGRVIDLRSEGRVGSTESTNDRLYDLVVIPIGSTDVIELEPYCPIRFRRMLGQFAAGTWADAQRAECPNVSIVISEQPADHDDSMGQTYAATVCRRGGD